MLQRGYRPIHAERNVANQFLIRGKLNGARCVFDVDTGAGSTDLDLSQLEKFQIGAREGIGSVRDIGANRAELRYATIRSLKIGAYQQQNFHAAVDELQFLKPKPGQVPSVILGLLGPDLLGKAQALIDCFPEPNST